MNKWRLLLSVCLMSSLTLNIYLLYQLSYHETQNQVDETAPQHLNEAPFKSAADQPSIQQTEATSADIFTSNNRNRQELLAQANTWFENKNWLQLGAFLQTYLRDYPQDMDFLLLEGKLNVETILLSDAIAYYYDLLRHAMTAAQQDEIEQQISSLSTTTIKHLKQNYSWDILAIFVEPLLQIDPTNRLYILSLAQAYAELVQFNLMEDVLAALPYGDPDADKIRSIAIAQQNIPATEGDVTNQTENTVASLGRPVTLKQFSDQYVVSASLSGNPVELLIDTGASITAISTEYFASLSNRYKVDYLGRFSIGTAGGEVMASIFQFRELTINHATVENLPVVVLPMEGIENAQGLLGMNFLREFDFKIDQRQALMFIK